MVLLPAGVLAPGPVAPQWCLACAVLIDSGRMKSPGTVELELVFVYDGTLCRHDCVCSDIADPVAQLWIAAVCF